MHSKNLLSLAVAALLAVALVVAFYLTWLWQPERQVARHQENLLKALSARDWQRAAQFFAPEYADRWGHDRESALQDCRIVLAQFITLEIRPENSISTFGHGTATVQAKLTLQGNGNEVATMAIQRANQLTTPFVFTWKKTGTKPWEWSLVKADNPSLEFHGFDY